MRAGFNKWWLLPLGMMTISALVVASFIVLTSKAHEDCSDAFATDYACYQQRYQNLVRDSGVKAAFAQLKDDYANDDFAKSACHELTHGIGRTAFELYGDLPRTYAQGDGFCSSGYYHGAMEAIVAKIGAQKILEEANTLCAELGEHQRYSFYHYNCVHGLGHGFMGVLQNELYEALEACDTLTDHWEKVSCYLGVFMENLIAENNPNHPSKYLKADQPFYPCTEVQNRYKEACYKMQTSHVLETQDNDFAKVFHLCATEAEENFRPACYNGVGRDTFALTSFDVNETGTTCMLGEDYQARSGCVIGAVRDFISFYNDDVEAKGFCASLTADLREVCLQAAEDYYRTFT